MYELMYLYVMIYMNKQGRIVEDQNTDDEIWLNLYVFRNVQINIIGDAYHCGPNTTIYN